MMSITLSMLEHQKLSRRKSRWRMFWRRTEMIMWRILRQQWRKPEEGGEEAKNEEENRKREGVRKREESRGKEEIKEKERLIRKEKIKIKLNH